MKWIVKKLCTVTRRTHGITEDNQCIYYTTGTDSTICCVNKVTLQRTIFVTIPNTELRGIVWNGNNILYICDWKNHHIYSCATDSKQVEIFAGTGSFQPLTDGPTKDATFFCPWDLVLDENNNMYVTNKHSIRKIDLSTKMVTTVAGANYIKSLQPQPNSISFEDGNASTAKFYVPSGITRRKDGTIFIADHTNCCIRQLRDGMVSTIAGTAEKQGYKDGMLSESVLDYVYDLTLDMDGSILFCSRENSPAERHPIRKVDLVRGVVSSVHINAIKESIYCLHINAKGTLFVGTHQAVYQADSIWNIWVRYLWIGHMKEELSYCHLARLPKEIIREIASQLQPS